MESDTHQVPERRTQEVSQLNQLFNTTPESDVAVLRTLARVLDEAVAIPGTKQKFGLDALLGLIPGVGDIGSAAIGGYILIAASKLGVPTLVMWRMIINTAIDTMLGAIPFVGDLFDVAFRSNSRNVRLLLDSVKDPQRARRSSRWVLVGLFLVFAAISAVSLLATFLVFRWLWRWVS